MQQQYFITKTRKEDKRLSLLGSPLTITWGKNTQHTQICFIAVSVSAQQIRRIFSIQAEIHLSLKQSLQQSFSTGTRLPIISRDRQNHQHFSRPSPRQRWFIVYNSLFPRLPGGTPAVVDMDWNPTTCWGTTCRQYTAYRLKISEEGGSNFVVNSKI